MWFVGLFVIDTACTLWLWREPYSPVRTLGCSLVVALVFALLDHLFAPPPSHGAGKTKLRTAMERPYKVYEFAFNALNFFRPFLASAIRVNSIALGLTKWLIFFSG